jgi:hypothetical protein
MRELPNTGKMLDVSVNTGYTIGHLQVKANPANHALFIFI